MLTSSLQLLISTQQSHTPLDQFSRSLPCLLRTAMQTDLFSSRSACQAFSALPARAWEIPLQPFPGLSPEMHTQNESIQSLSTFLFLVPTAGQ